MGNTAGTPAAPERQQPERENEENKLPPGVFANTIVLPPTEGQPEDEEYFGPVDEDNRQHGVGTVLYADRDPGERSKFHGEWVHGKRHGYGVLIWRNGSRYEGHFIDDKLGGQGVLCWSVGLEYRGEWINNYAHGRGELRFPNGKRYYGEWAHGKRHGWGQLSFPPNDEKQRVEYIGGWADDLQSGEGVMKWSNNASYSGQWLAGKRHGYGVHTFPYAYFSHLPPHADHGRRTGERYEGEWKEGIRHGQGRRHYPDGSIYEGGWCRDKKHGSSRMILPHGETLALIASLALSLTFHQVASFTSCGITAPSCQFRSRKVRICHVTSFPGTNSPFSSSDIAHAMYRGRSERPLAHSSHWVPAR